MRSSITIFTASLLSLAAFVSHVAADATIKRTVDLPSGMSKTSLCRAWKAECEKETTALGMSRLLRCKPVTLTTVTVTCVSKDLKNAKTPEGQLTDAVIKALGLSYATGSTKPVTTSSTTSSSAAVATSNVTIKRTVKIPTHTTLSGLCRLWKNTCLEQASTLYNTGFLYRCKAVGTTSATVTCVSKNFVDTKDKVEHQLTDSIISKLGLVKA